MFENCFILILASDYKRNEVVSLLFYKNIKDYAHDTTRIEIKFID